MQDPMEVLWDLDKLNRVCPPPLTYVDWTEEDLQAHAKFKTLAEAEAFAACYSVARGFTYRIGYTKNREPSRKGPGMVDAHRRWVCSRSGTKKESASQRFAGKITRDNCGASLTISWSDVDKCYRVIGFKPHHNHILLTGKESRMLPSNSKLTKEQKQQIRDLSGAGVRAGRIYDYMANGAGGYEYVGFKIKTLYNFMHADTTELIKDGDAVTALAYIAGKVTNGGDSNLYCRYADHNECVVA